jgi:hypothetical protein
MGRGHGFGDYLCKSDITTMIALARLSMQCSDALFAEFPPHGRHESRVPPRSPPMAFKLVS